MWLILAAFLLVNLCYSLSMDFVWSTISFVQLATHLIKLSTVILPPEVKITLEQVHLMCFFDVNKYPVINEWLKERALAFE